MLKYKIILLSLINFIQLTRISNYIIDDKANNEKYLVMGSEHKNGAQIRIKNANKTELRKIFEILFQENSKTKKEISLNFKPKRLLVPPLEEMPLSENLINELMKDNSTKTTTTLKTDNSNNEHDLFAYLFKVESNDNETSAKNVLYSKENIAAGQLQYLENDKLTPKVNTKILAKLFEILNKNFLVGVNGPNLVHKTHEFYDEFYNNLIQELELVEEEINEQPEQPENSVSDFIKSNEQINSTHLDGLNRKLSPFLKKIYRLKRVKNLNDLITQFRRDQDEIDYGTILYVGKRNES